ncbi:MAG TPA: NAD(P)/FAD-dependent oxidoreductase [Candidatus Acidoferrum sp.]|nr:NAD(P)/FAD-dependent oxidoreductase [Candidatus Acidoferrum sp.]
MREGTGVLVIGGGPAGLAAAIAARMKGFEVTVADGAKPPIDKACGEGLMPSTMAALRELGVAICPGNGQVLRGVCFKDAATSVEASFSGASGFGVRRTVLHQKMVDRAQECGITLLWNTPVAGLTSEGAILGDTAMKARWIIGADGIHSRVRRWIGLKAKARQEMRFAQRRHFRVKAWTDCMEIHWGQKSQAYVTPLSNDETCVVLISRDPRIRLEDAWRKFPSLASHLCHAEPSSAERGAVTVTRRLGQVYRGNIALTGDASGSVDAITGEGLCLSFHQAIALADALGKGKLESYQRAHRRLARRPNTMGRLLLLLDRYPSLRKRALRGLAEEPELFARLLAAHLGEASPKFLAAMSLRLGWQFLTA